jgi:3-dehydroquinate synthase
MVMACELSHALGLVDRAFVHRMTELITKAGLPTRAPDLGLETFLEHMSHDKKAVGGEIQFVVIKRPGEAVVCKAPQALVQKVIETCTSP